MSSRMCSITLMIILGGGGFQQMALYTIRVSSTLIWFSLKLGLCVDAVKF